MKSLVFITANSFTTWNASIFYINNVFKSKKREKKKGRKKKEKERGKRGEKKGGQLYFIGLMQFFYNEGGTGGGAPRI